MEDKERLTILVSPDEKAKIIRDAKERGLTASAYIRLVLSGQLEARKRG